MVYTINSLKKADSESVYVLNTSISVSKHKRATNVAFEISYADRTRSVLVLVSWIPQDLSMQAPKEVLLASPTFRECLNKGLLELVPDKEAESILQDEDSIIETQRLRNKMNKVSLESDIEVISKENSKPIEILKPEENDGISPMIKDMCVRDDLEAVEVYSQLRSAEKTLSREEWKHLDKNLQTTSRNDKINTLISKHLSK